MPKIIHHLSDNTTREYRLENNRMVSVGREDNNDIVLRDASVSSYHTEIESDGDLFFLTDRQSRNGSFVNEQLVISRPLKHQDVITIGNQTLQFLYEADEKQPENVDADFMGKTMTLDTHAHRAQVVKGVSGMAQKKVIKMEKETVGVLTFIAGGEGEITISKEIVKIGKSASSDIVVRGLMLGKTAATITQQNHTYFLNYGDGMTKPKLNYKTVKTWAELKEFDVIEIGSVKLQFHLKKQ